MTRNIPWIWFTVLLMAVALLLAGCGEPSRAEREKQTADVDQLSPTEVDRAPQATPPAAPTEDPPTPPTAKVEPRVDAAPIVPTPVAEPEAPRQQEA